MKRRLKKIVWMTVCAVVVLCASVYGATVDVTRLTETMSELLATPHRLAGSDEGRAAGDTILRRLREAGVTDDQILVQPFAMPQLEMADGDCYFKQAGQRFPMQPLRPNGLALPVTPIDGLTAPTVYLADGHWEHFEGKEIRDHIAIFDYNCAERWTRAVQAGAVAVMFVGEREAAPSEAFHEEDIKFYFAHLDIPRFFVESEIAAEQGLLNGTEITLFSRMGFERVEGRNLYVFIPGTQPVDESPADTLVLATHYDTFGTLPFATQLPQEAANVAGLIETVAWLQHNPLERPVLAVFFDNEAQQQAGQYQFLYARDAYRPSDVPGSFLRMIRDRDREHSFLKGLLEAIEDPVALMERRSEKPAASKARQSVLDTIEQIYNQRVSALSDVRREINLLDRRIARLEMSLRRLVPGRSTDEDDERAALQLELDRAERLRELTRDDAMERLEQAEHDRDIVFSVRVLLTAERVPGADDDPEERAFFETLISDVQQSWQDRLKEQSREREILEHQQALGERLDEHRLVNIIVFNLLPAPRNWAVLGPAEDVQHASLSNPHVIRWMRETYTPSVATPKTSPAPMGYVPDFPSPAAARVSGRTTFILELANPGAVQPVPPPPAESSADMVAYAAQLEQALDFIRQLAQVPELGRTRIPPRLTATLTFNVPEWDGTSYDGSYVRHYDERFKAGENAPGAVVLAMERGRVSQRPPLHGWGGHLMYSSHAGTFPLLTDRGARMAIQAALHDDQGRIKGISLRSPGGGLGVAGSWELAGWYFADRRNQILISEADVRVMLAGIRTPMGLASEAAVRFIDGITESAPKEMNLTLGGDMLAVYAGRVRRYKVLHGAQLLLNNSEVEPVGDGYEPEPGFVDAQLRSARDTWILNESRLDSLRRRNVMQHSLERLHAQAERFLDQATAETVSPAQRWSRTLASRGYSARVYEPVRDVTNDLVTAIVILLLLAIPFAFAFERAVIGTPNIYRQIGGFVVVFGVVFTILYLVHPAFRFVSFPIVVLLAFVIIIMSSFVIAIMWQKFEYEMRKLHGLATASHQSTRTARGMIGAAVALGIATMRRRPLRSVLTAVTILLLTFTILFFGSFKSEDGVRQIYVGPGPRMPLVEIGSVPGSAFDEQAIVMLRELHEDEADSYFRTWNVADEHESMAGRFPDDTVFTVSGQATLPPQDLRLYPELRDILDGDLEGFTEEGGVFLPPEIYRRLPEHVRTNGAAVIELAGQRHVLRGTFDPVRLGALRTLDGASFVPPNLEEVNRQLEQEYPNDPLAIELRLEEMELEDYPPLDPETVSLVWQPRAPRLNMPIRSLVFLPQTEAQARRIASDLAIQLSRRASFAAGGDHFRALYATEVSMGGLARVVVPLVLGGLIIFGTMLSSVSDRQREIFTFSALGLGPRHVATLFFAEAAVYAVVGGMGGYLFAHVFSKLVEWMAQQGWVGAPAMNHSSLNAMLTLLMVMLTVLASTVYPAFRASRSANPGAQRQWRMPEPEGDWLRLEFPFTVSDYDMVGLVSFLEEYLASHSEKSVGLFAANDVEVQHKDERFTLQANVWLQPFDQGISQTFSLWTQPSRIEGIDQVHVAMQRRSGSPAIWRRSSRVFIHELRNQFILWRTIPDDAADHYYRMTAERFGIREDDSQT